VNADEHCVAGPEVYLYVPRFASQFGCEDVAEIPWLEMVPAGYVVIARASKQQLDDELWRHLSRMEQVFLFLLISLLVLIQPGFQRIDHSRAHILESHSALLIVRHTPYCVKAGRMPLPVR
jgi:hypothetical protein